MFGATSSWTTPHCDEAFTQQICALLYEYTLPVDFNAITYIISDMFCGGTAHVVSGELFTYCRLIHPDYGPFSADELRLLNLHTNNRFGIIKATCRIARDVKKVYVIEYLYSILPNT